MKEQHRIDDLFRQGLADYRVGPSPGSRERFLNEASKRSFGRKSWLWLGGVIVVMGVMSVMVVMNVTNVTNVTDVTSVTNVKDVTNVTNVKGSQNSNVASNQQPASRISNPASSIQNPPTTNHQPPTTTNQSPSSAPPALASSSKPASQGPAGSGNNTNPNETKGIEPTNSKDVSQKPATSDQQPATSDQQPAPTISYPESRIPNPASRIPHPESRIQPPVTNNEQALTTNHQPPITNNEQVLTTNHQPPTTKQRGRSEGETVLPRKWNLSIGASYTPEWMFNTLNGDKFVNNAGLEGTFRFGPYSVRTGIGMSITTGSNEVLVQSNSYLGKYNALDSITFHWDEQGYYLVPTYYTTGKQVYDTALKYNYTYNKKRYNYLQVPLILGYDFWKNSWLSLGIRAGAVMNVLLSTTELSAYDPGTDRIVTMNSVSPDRISLNWQAIGGINASFRLSRRFYLEVEPQARYYFNSVYESSELTKKPWSVGVRAALRIEW